MNVILVNPKMCSPRSMRLPLSLLALGAVLDGRHPYVLVDGHVDGDAAGTVLRHLAADADAVVGLTVMPGPQVAPAIAIAEQVRARYPQVPIVWGGYFPTLYADAAINAPYVDYVVRGQGEVTLLELLDRVGGQAPGRRSSAMVDEVAGLTWKRDGVTVHNPDRAFRPPDTFPMYPYGRLGDVRPYLRPSFMGTRTAVHQAAIGCRYRCAFCGVVSMFDGHTTLQGPARLDEALRTLKGLGANAVQFYDHNFFDDEESSIPLLEVIARHELPWWCYARTDTLARFSTRTWELIRRSGLKMAYVGAEAASDAVLRSMQKGSKVEYTLQVAELSRAHGVIPEFSFVLGGPEDPAGEIEHTFQFVKRLKRLHPQAEIILYFYSPTPQRPPRRLTRDDPAAARPTLATYGPGGPPLPTTPEGWTDPTWVDYVSHRDAPWLTPALRRRVRDMAEVLACRFPTVQDYHTPRWGKQLLRGLAGWRYATGQYRHPVELKLARRLVALREPARESI